MPTSIGNRVSAKDGYLSVLGHRHAMLGLHIEDFGILPSF